MKKIFKLNELRHGKIYRANNYKLYRLNDERLQWKSRSGEWKDSTKTYNEFVDFRFTLLSEGCTFKEAMLALSEGATIENYNGWKYKIDAGLFKILKTKDSMDKAGIFNFEDCIFSYEEINSVWFIERF